MARTQIPARVTAKTDEELIAICEPRSWEKRLKSFGCVTSLLVSVAGAYVLSREGWFSPGLSVLFVFVSSICLSILLGRVRTFRARHSLEELTRRYKQGHISDYIQEAETRLKTVDAPDWICLLNGHGPYRGQYCHIEVDLREGESNHSKSICLTSSPISRIRKETVTFDRHEAELSSADHDCLRSMCSELKLYDWGNASPGDRDGFMCDVIVLRKEPAGLGRGHCNLAGIRTITLGRTSSLGYFSSGHTKPDNLSLEASPEEYQPIRQIAAMVWQIARPVEDKPDGWITLRPTKPSKNLLGFGWLRKKRNAARRKKKTNL